MTAIDRVSLRDFRLSPVEPQHTAELFRWAVSLDAGFRWRYGGGTPSPAQFTESLWAGVLCQYVVVDRKAQLHGLVVGYGADHVHQFAYFAVQGNPDRASGTGAMIGVLQLVDHMFASWPFRKLYVDIPGYNEAEFTGVLRRHLEVEGRLVGHVYHGGRFWDMITATLTRERWYTTVRPRFAALLAQSPTRGSA